MFITVISDCTDANAVGRQLTRYASLFGITPGYVPVESGEGASEDTKAELEAAGNLIDCLDASQGKKGIIVVNVAPRSGAGKQWPNGTPFCYFYFKETLVLSSVAGLALSLIKRLSLTNAVTVIDLEASVGLFTEEKIINGAQGERIKKTQFRSFDFLPYAAYWLSEKDSLPGEEYAISDIADASERIWKIDNFGNCKTTLFEEDMQDGKCNTRWGILPYYARLKDVAPGEAAIIVGSSGIEDKRFCEIVIQGESASKRFKIEAGDSI